VCTCIYIHIYANTQYGHRYCAVSCDGTYVLCMYVWICVYVCIHTYIHKYKIRSRILRYKLSVYTCILYVCVHVCVSVYTHIWKYDHYGHEYCVVLSVYKKSIYIWCIHVCVHVCTRAQQYIIRPPRCIQSVHICTCMVFTCVYVFICVEV